MLTIIVPGPEVYNDVTDEFSTEGDVVLELEHSLVSLSKWESEFEKPFLGKDDKSAEELMAYIKAMTLTPEVPEEIFHRLSSQNVEDINVYLNSKRTGTKFFGGSPQPRSSETITSELIYYWMIQFNIDMVCENWHLNRLFTLIQVCNHKQSKPKKMNRNEIAQRNRELNEQRRKQLGTTG